MGKKTPEEAAAELESFCRSERSQERPGPWSARAITIEVIRGTKIIASQTFDQEVIKIGRLESCHLCLQDQNVARIHAVVEVSAAGEITIIDLGNATGTRVKGKEVSKATLKPGDVVQVGDTHLVFGKPGRDQAKAFDVDKAFDVVQVIKHLEQSGGQAPGSGPLSDTKVCPECAETVKAAAKKCRFCGYRFDG